MPVVQKIELDCLQKLIHFQSKFSDCVGKIEKQIESVNENGKRCIEEVCDSELGDRCLDLLLLNVGRRSW